MESPNGRSSHIKNVWNECSNNSDYVRSEGFTSSPSTLLMLNKIRGLCNLEWSIYVDFHIMCSAKSTLSEKTIIWSIFLTFSTTTATAPPPKVRHDKFTCIHYINGEISLGKKGREKQLCTFGFLIWHQHSHMRPAPSLGQVHMFLPSP